MAGTIRHSIGRSLSSCTSSVVIFRSGKSCSNTGYRASNGGSRFVGGLERCAFEGTCSRSATSLPGPRASAFASKCATSSVPGWGRWYAAQIARFPGEIAALQSLMPLYSATANSRLVSRLGTSGDAPILQDDSDGT